MSVEEWRIVFLEAILLDSFHIYTVCVEFHGVRPSVFGEVWRVVVWRLHLTGQLHIFRVCWRLLG